MRGLLHLVVELLDGIAVEICSERSRARSKRSAFSFSRRGE